ncbi:unnamed protein product [Moneuplotes crassus]|uniref:AAA+ ATPase domain-containing protein n=1 Tax=Euplotes crassus TaxID=5936 RepID=A0AAD1XMS1_EUPCR|nr:unnamed protein product [Moneuplotes crassus]
MEDNTADTVEDVQMVDPQENEKIIPFVEKFRPKTLDEIISHDEIIDTIKNFIKSDRIPHLLFHGPPGTGKTSCMLAIAKLLHGENYKKMVLELNASDDRGIGTVRDKIKAFSGTSTFFTKGIKLVILDECDNVTNAAQAALRRIIEMNSTTTRFCLICNNVAKVIPAIQSRCTKFRFSPLKDEFISKRLDEICESEEIDIDQKAKDAIVKLAKGDMRKVLNILESGSLAHSKITSDDIYNCTGKPSEKEILMILKSLCKDNFSDSLNTVLKIKNASGLTLDDILNDLHERVLKSKFEEKHKKILTIKLAEIQERTSIGCSEYLQISSLVGAFIEVRA